MKPGQKFSEGDLRNDSFYFKDENIKRTNDFLNKIKPLANEKKATLGQVVISWTLSQPGITVALVGARNLKQATENAKAADIKFSSEETDFITKELNKVELIR
jgi:aryl-alcohol dehydrogenase-like predicted oxidoreductase